MVNISYFTVMSPTDLLSSPAVAVVRCEHAVKSDSVTSKASVSFAERNSILSVLCDVMADNHWISS